MRLIPENVLLGFLGDCIGLSAEILPRLQASGTSPVGPELLKKYHDLIAGLQGQKRADSVLCDESWEWIWEIREGMSYIQVYGRLAWLNYNLFDLL